MIYKYFRFFIALLLFAIPFIISNINCGSESDDDGGSSSITCDLIDYQGTCNHYSGSGEMITIARALCLEFGSLTTSCPTTDLIGQCTVEETNPQGTIIINYYSPEYNDDAEAELDCQTTQGGTYNANP